MRLEIEALRDADYDLNLVGFEDEELDRLQESQDAKGGLTDEGAVPEPQEFSDFHSQAIFGDLAIIVFYAAMQLRALK